MKVQEVRKKVRRARIFQHESKKGHEVRKRFRRTRITGKEAEGLEGHEEI
jgi:hypothetical protein